MKKTKYCDNIIKYKSDLYMIARAILKNETDTEDAVSNAILKGYESIEQLKNPHKFKQWMLKITKNEALRLKKKRLDLPGDDAVEAMLKPVEDHYDEMWDIFHQIKEEYRLVVVLFYYDDLSIQDISKVLNIPIGTVKSRLNRGKEALKNALEKRDVE